MKAIGLLLLLLGAGLLGSAQTSQEKNSYFDANCLNILSGKDNTLLEINFNPQLFHIELGSGNAVAQLDIRLGVRARKSRSFLVQRQFMERIEHRFLDSENVFFRRYGFNLPPGVYSVEIAITDRHDGKLYFASLDFDCKDLTKGFQMSDIVLEQDFLGALGAQKLLTGKISPHPGNLRYWLEIYAPTPAPLTCRAVLFRKTGQQMAQVNRFSAMNQQVAILKPAGGKVRFADTLALEGLESGEYLLEVYLEQDQKLLAEESRAFTVEWKKAGRVFGNLDLSIQMMRYIAIPTQMRELLNSPSEEEKIERFQRFWENIEQQPGGTSIQRMEDYFDRAFFAQDNFGEASREGYLTDRGRTYILYGPPARQSSAVINGFEASIWDYQQPKLRFVFLNRGKGWEYQTP
jgi:GWxTD domain-containing protein